MNKSWLIFAIAAGAVAQQAPDEQVRTRQLWDTTLLDKRPSPHTSTAVKRPPRNSLSGALVGVTVWRLRKEEPGDAKGTRALIQEGAGQEWVPERVSSTMPLAEDQRVRISIEAEQEGFLYVIDRDGYADGTKGDPYLIFPTTRTRHGDNRVTAGMIVDIPDQSDATPYFNVKRSRADQIDEVLTFLIAPKPLSELRIGRDRLKLSAEQVAVWEKQWKAKSERLEDAASVGKVYTVAEKSAARGESLLTKDDPLPQTMYHVDCKPGAAVLIDVPLKIGR